MRIVVVTSYYKPAYIYGGPVHSISTMCEALVALGANVTVLTTNANGTQRLDVPMGQLVHLEGVEVFYYPVVPILPHFFFYSPGLAQAGAQRIGQFELAVLETIFAHAMGPAVAACKRARVPYIIPPRGHLLPWALRQRRLKKQIYLVLMGRTYLDGAAALHCTDPVEARALAGLGLRAPAFVVPNGVDTSRFEHLGERRGSLRRRLRISPGAIVLLFLGRLHRKKRPDIAVEALGASQSLSSEVHLVMAGPDEENLGPALRSQAQRLGCDERLHLVGLLNGNEVLGALADAELLLMPSEPQSENFGVSAVEALAAGVSILVSVGVPVGYWAEKAGAGRVVPCTTAAFVQATLELLTKPGQLQIMGRRGKELVRQQFDIAMIARQMLAQYQAIVSSGRPLPEE